MHNFLNLLISTVLFRPYVFAFLAIYLAAAVLKVGLRRAGLFTLSAWAVAYAAESSSVRNGFPFGLYHYIPSTVDRELWIFGVPFMDSLSFTFLNYASWTLAGVLAGRQAPTRRKAPPSPAGGEGNNPFSFPTIFLGALLLMLVDVVIDPLALRGDRWFLGKIYYYPHGGAYFGVTLSNFAGWFFVGLATLVVWRWIDSINPHPLNPPLPCKGEGEGSPPPCPPPQVGRVKGNGYADMMGPALYFIVLLFNLSMTFYIGEYALGLAGVAIFLPVAAWFAVRVRRIF